MKQELIFIPVLAQILLVIWLYFRLAIAKSRASDEGEVDEQRRALDENAWPAYVRQINNNIRNQFEAPVLFYVLCLLIYQLQAASPGIIAAASAFVLSRFIHSYIHTGSNTIPTRRALFTAGILILMGLSVYVLSTIAATQ